MTSVQPVPRQVDEHIEVRGSHPSDRLLADAAARLIADASRSHDVARRDPRLLAERIEAGMAALAIRAGELVGFGYFCAWEGGRYVSHSGLVVREDLRDRGLGRRLKLVLLHNSRQRYPGAITMSLTSSPQVRLLNLSLGFRVARRDELTSDPAFWAGCGACRNYEGICCRGERPRCHTMLLQPEVPLEPPS
ncbi:MAG: hypothetical protein IPM29_11690 [Planctomycetes bacterium]|nr:hypothetical protein [Planctomycetota bacterium]